MYQGTGTHAILTKQLASCILQLSEELGGEREMMGKVIANFYCQASGKSAAEDFICSLDARSRRKFYFVLELLEDMGRHLPEPYSKYIGNEIFELRFSGVEGAVRVLYFFFHQDMVILTNGFLKKTDKTPENEKAVAVSRRKDFLEKNGKRNI